MKKLICFIFGHKDFEWSYPRTSSFHHPPLKARMCMRCFKHDMKQPSLAEYNDEST